MVARNACGTASRGTATSRTRYPGLADRVLGEIRERGALGSKDFAGKADPAPHRAGTSSEAMWSWKPAKQMLDALFASGELVVAEPRELPSPLRPARARPTPREILDAPVPSEEEADQGADRAGRSRPRRAARVRDRRARSADLGLQFGGAKVARPYVDSLVADGKLERIAVDDGGEPVVVEAGVELDRPRPNAAVLLSPFDNLLWELPVRRASSGSST